MPVSDGVNVQAKCRSEVFKCFVVHYPWAEILLSDCLATPEFDITLTIIQVETCPLTIEAKEIRTPNVKVIIDV